jgi:plasmid stabilization system protein ParE
MRLVWTPRGVRGYTQEGEPVKDLRRISIRGFHKGYEAELESNEGVVIIVSVRGQEVKREVTPRARPEV